jgi:hypothetical protein
MHAMMTSGAGKRKALGIAVRTTPSLRNCGAAYKFDRRADKAVATTVTIREGRTAAQKLLLR